MAVFDEQPMLRHLPDRHPVRVVAVSSGKGGVGKTHVTVNLGLALAASGQRVMLMDADLGLANIDVLLGLHPRWNLSHVVSGERSLDEVVVQGPHGMLVVPAASGLQSMSELSPAEYAGLICAFNAVSHYVDILLVDTAAGISNSVVTFSSAAQEVIIVVCDEPASITDAYALIKHLNREHGVARFHIVANMVNREEEGVELYRKMVRVTDRFLDASVDYMGAVPYDLNLRRALQKQHAVVEAYPKSPSAIAFRGLAAQVGRWPTTRGASGQLQFFLERIVQENRHGDLLLAG